MKQYPKFNIKYMYCEYNCNGELDIELGLFETSNDIRMPVFYETIPDVEAAIQEHIDDDYHAISAGYLDSESQSKRQHFEICKASLNEVGILTVNRVDDNSLVWQGNITDFNNNI